MIHLDFNIWFEVGRLSAYRERLGLTKEECQAHLIERYGKRNFWLLSNEQILDYSHWLKKESIVTSRL
ncbi:hypothetical protein A5482_014810 (plasmid) [Cyanobacterium sp. IPPAS B-1200]|uniref:hypothetical protein n=1 Tax=Cyanobacterium sp. IPPAS B-1200 TaxID=1562720 RepID=UPI0008525604|nr:hypothetical protein [Cyanobacterium sp. IPPAS B-1200]OEJ77733.1 hypothetical protein A5482_15145 [Cyanobacterium sp. IPPAS B-1200]